MSARAYQTSTSNFPQDLSLEDKTLETVQAKKLVNYKISSAPILQESNEASLKNVNMATQLIQDALEADYWGTFKARAFWQTQLMNMIEWGRE